MTSQFFDSIGIKYQSSFSHDRGLISFVTSSVSLLPKDGTILDIGCGTGKPTAEIIVKSGRSVHGIDFSPIMISLSRQQVPSGTFEEVNLLEFNPTRQFDAAFANFSLFGVSREQMEVLAKKVATWIKVGGYLFVGTMVADDFDTSGAKWDNDGLVARGIEHTFMGTKIENLFYSKNGWQVLLQGNGFEGLGTKMARYQPAGDVACDEEPHFYITAKKVDGDD
ncbi:S-adenosyl-L-methionine-dependent methyltransferase [Stipitochalara longipes BDJ]|nr:S-adenosyl-L-methionine-dependent methyltransferase [Stipitochalara longipes BDJ]